MPKPTPVLPSPALDNKIRDYVLTITERGRKWWNDPIEQGGINRWDELKEYRLRAEGRRSVAELYRDVKSEPFDGASNIGVGIESIFTEFLIPLLLANTHDLEPKLQAMPQGTKTVDTDLTTFHDAYHHYQVPSKRELLEYSIRDLLTVGSCFHKWTYQTFWAQSVVNAPVWMDPLTGQPHLQFDPGSGRMLPLPADPKTPPERIPTHPLTGQPLTLGKVRATHPILQRQGPELSVRPVEQIGFPAGERRPDPNQWDWISDDFEVSAYWLLGKEGDPFEGNYRLGELWKQLAIDPNELSNNPTTLAAMTQPIRLRAFHGKYPASVTGEPIEIVALMAWELKLLLGWQPSPFPRRPYFNRQVWHAGTSPLGKGIPETVFSLRSGMDAVLNQDVDAGNLYNHPPLLLSDRARLDDEDFEMTGPGAVWIMQDINGAKFLPPPIVQRNPVEMLNWLISMTQRLWGVTDLNLNAPTSTLSPNVTTAHGTMAILNQGAVKFGHLTKRLSTVDTQEYQYVHDAFRLMLTNPMLVTVNGKPQMLDSAKREDYFSEHIRLTAVGNGISTNPILRQQTYAQFLQLAFQTQNPFIFGDLAVLKQTTEQWIASYGLDLTLQEPAALQQNKVFQELMQTPLGQQLIPAAMQQTIAGLRAQAAGAVQPHGLTGPPAPTANDLPPPGASNGNRLAPFPP